MKVTVTKWRRALRWLAGLFAFTGIAVLSLPVWFPWLLKPVLGHYGIRYDAYDRLGYTRFSLAGLKGRWPDVSFEANLVRSVLPTAWLWQRFQRDTNGVPILAASGWRALIGRSDANVRARRTHSMFEVLDRIVPVAATLQREAPLAHFTDGVIEGDAWRIGLPEIGWREGRLSGALRVQGFPETIQVAAGLDNKSALLLLASLEASSLSVESKLERESAAWRLRGQGLWLTNRFEFSAGFGDTTGWWPSGARLDARQLRVPAKLLRLQGYDDPMASLAFSLVSNQFLLQANAIATPSKPSVAPMLPKVETILRVRGNPALATVEQFEIRTPWLRTELMNTCAIRLDGSPFESDARFQVELDLAGLPQGSLTGKVDGFVHLEFADVRKPTARFEFSTTNLVAWEVEPARIRLNGQFDWPVLTLGECHAEFGGGSAFSLAGTCDVATREIGAVNWRFSGPPLSQQLAGFRYETLDASGRVEGAFTNLSHSGAIALARVGVPALKPFDARARWRGTNLHFAFTDLEMSAGDSLLSLGGECRLGSIAPAEVEVMLETAILKRGSAERYSLARPVAVRFQGSASKGSQKGCRLAVDELEWTGGNRKIALRADLDWPARGAATAKAENLDLGDFSDFMSTAFTNAFLERIDFEAGWTNGPLYSVLTFAAAQALPGGQRLGASGTLRSSEVLTVDQLTLTTENALALFIDGTVPITLTPGATQGWLSPGGSGELDLKANLKPVETVSLRLGGLGDAMIARPQLAIQAGGTLEVPSVSLNLAVPRVQWQSAGTNDGVRPGLEQLQLSAVASPSLVALRQLSAQLDGEEFRAAGEWPLPAGSWQELVAGKGLPDWSAARGQLMMTNARMAALARYLPSLLAPEGSFSVDLALQPQKKLGGSVWLTNAATRPLGNVSPLRDVTARVQFTDDRASLEEFRGQVGGQPVRATGQLQLNSGRLGNFQVSLQGSNVPLARSLEFLLRGDFDLQLKGSGTLPAQVSGKVNLRDGLYVQSATALMSSRLQRPALRPPYFSLTNEPFADWRLNVTVAGDRFLRVRTPVFNGVASADLKLDGTLREPVATGDARVNSGRIIFPFGTLRVDQAQASLDGNDPRGPDLLLNASGRTYGYDLRLEASGPADGANVVFSSTPPLSSEEILLMLTAGELPRDERAFSTETRAGRLATFWGRDFVSRFSGKDTAGERFIINTGENLTEEGRTTYSVEYRLTDRWSLIGEYDRFSALNASVKWKIFSR